MVYSNTFEGGYSPESRENDEASQHLAVTGITEQIRTGYADRPLRPPVDMSATDPGIPVGQLRVMLNEAEIDD